MGARILLVEVFPPLALDMTSALVSDGFAVDHAPNTAIAGARAIDDAVDLVILDIGGSCARGIAFCLELRAKWPRVSVMVMSARDCVSGRIQMLKLGADDYIVRPIGTEELPRPSSCRTSADDLGVRTPGIPIWLRACGLLAQASPATRPAH